MLKFTKKYFHPIFKDYLYLYIYIHSERKLFIWNIKFRLDSSFFLKMYRIVRMNVTLPLPLSGVFQGHGETAHEMAGFAVPLSPKVRKEMDISGLPMTARTVRKLKDFFFTIHLNFFIKIQIFLLRKVFYVNPSCI